MTSAAGGGHATFDAHAGHALPAAVDRAPDQARTDAQRRLVGG